MHCLPEARYLRERIRIRDGGDSDYLKRIGEVLKNNGCIWIAGERTRVKKLFAAELLGHVGHFPVGAPTLALRHNATQLPVHTERLGRFHYRVNIEAPIPLDPNMRRNEVIDRAVQDYAQRLAARIIENPGDWDWDYSWVENLLTRRSTDCPQSSHPEQAAE
jgi:lauroyl/myristoyl acyltransferase